MSNSGSNKRIAKNTVMLYIRMFVTMGVLLYTSRIVLNTLGVEDFGIYNVVGGVVAMFAFLNGAMGASTSRFMTIELGKGDLEQLQKVFSVTIINHLIIIAIIFILGETIGLWFVCNELVIPEDRMHAVLWLYQFAILSSMVTFMQTPFNAVIIAHEKMNVYAWSSLGDSILKLLVVYILILLPYDKLILYGLLMFIVVCCLLLFYCFYVKYAFPYCFFSFQKDRKMYKILFAYSGWDLIGNFSIIAQGQGLNMLLNIFFGPTVNAARSITYQVQGAISQFGNNFMTAVQPQIIKYYATGEKEKMIELVFASSKYSFFLTLMLSFPIFIEAEYVLTLWLKIVPEHTVEFTRIIILIALINSFRTPIITAMHATGKIKVPNIICGILLISTLPISYFFLKWGYAPESVFMISFIITVLSMWTELYLIKKLVGYSISQFFKKVFLLSTIVAFISSIPLYLVYINFSSSFSRLIAICCLSVITVTTIVYMIGIGKSTRLLINNKIRQNINKVKNNK